MGGNIGQTTEALSARTADPGDAKVGKVDGSRIVIAQGPGFIDQYMTEFIQPRRFDTAQLVVSALLQASSQDARDALTDPSTRQEMAKLIAMAGYAVADELMLGEKESLKLTVGRYWQAYLDRDKETDAIIESLIEESHDYSL